MSGKAGLSLICLKMAAGCASEGGKFPAGKVADIRAMEAESAARLTAKGEILYDADSRKQNGYDYCSLAYDLSEQGALRQAIRMASKAPYLEHVGRDLFGLIGE